MAGQIIERGKNTYLVRVYMGLDANGKRKYHNKTIHGNKKDAERYRNKVAREKDLGTFVEPTKEALAGFLDNWLEQVVKARVRERTYNDYSDKVRLYIKPSLGDYKLQQIDPEKINALYNKMLEDGLSARSVRFTHTVLRNALEQAVKWGKLYRNPADLVDLPRQNKKEMKALSPEQAGRFLEATIYSPHKALFSLLISSGVRPGEALGLKWDDVDFENKRIIVRRALSSVSGGGWKLEEPKTSRSRRTIPLPLTTMKDLREHEKDQAAEKLKSEPGKYNDQGFVFAYKNGEPLTLRNLTRRHFKPLLEKAGLPDIRLYDLRHTCATLLLSAGENPKVVSERLGHASVTLTLDTYSHVLPDMQESAASKLENMLFGNQ